MEKSSVIARLARRLTWVGTALLLGAVGAFVWAIGFTTGVDGLIDGLVVTSVGFLIPGLVVYWVAWFIASSDVEDRAAWSVASPAAASRMRTHPPTRVDLVLRYAAAVVAVGVAWLLRWGLSAYVGPTSVPFATFFLAVAFSAAFGGIGPGVLAVAGGLLVAWYSFVAPSGEFGVASGSEIVTLGLYLAIALAVVGLISGLQAARAHAAALIRELGTRREPSAEDRRARDAAEQSPAMIWTTDASGALVFGNRALLHFAGAASAEQAWSSWGERVHPDDRASFEAAVTHATAARIPVSQRVRMCRHDGVYRLVAFEARPRFDVGGRFDGFAGTMVELAADADAEVPALPRADVR